MFLLEICLALGFHPSIFLIFFQPALLAPHIETLCICLRNLLRRTHFTWGSERKKMVTLPLSWEYTGHQGWKATWLARFRLHPSVSFQIRNPLWIKNSIPINLSVNQYLNAKHVTFKISWNLKLPPYPDTNYSEIPCSTLKDSIQAVINNPGSTGQTIQS